MPQAFFERDLVTLQEGNHILAQIGDKTFEPDETKSISGEVERVTIYHSPDSTTELRCTRDIRFSPGEKVIFQQLGNFFQSRHNRSIIDEHHRSCYLCCDRHGKWEGSRVQRVNLFHLML